MDSIIKSIDGGSPLRHKVRVGESVIAINGNKIIDVLDYKFFSYDADITVTVRSEDGKEREIRVRKPEGMDLGLEFESYLMDKPRSCANKCVFCFIDQLPPGMRKTMYFKDDDARLSFLLGNYITLTNLSKREIERIIALRISPINVSVHTTNKALRCMMLNNPRAGETIDVMRSFAENGITMNCQIVCCRGLNDGDELLRTMRDLEEMYPGVHSVSVVPFGMTDYREGLYPIEPFTKESAAAVLDAVESFSEKCLEKHGTRIFFCGDELYLKAGRELPDEEFYEEYTQLENGVGMLRLMETEFMSALKLSDEPDGVPFSVATGAAAYPLMKKLVCTAEAKYDILKGNVYQIDNDFFGRNVTVAGLITGRDLINQLKGKELGERLFISHDMLRRDEMDFLDGVTLEEASRALGVPIYPTECDGFALWDAMAGELPEVCIPRISEETEYYKYNQNGRR